MWRGRERAHGRAAPLARSPRLTACSAGPVPSSLPLHAAACARSASPPLCKSAAADASAACRAPSSADTAGSSSSSAAQATARYVTRRWWVMLGLPPACGDALGPMPTGARCGSGDCGACTTGDNATDAGGTACRRQSSK